MGEQSSEAQPVGTDAGASPAADTKLPRLSGDWAKWLTAAAMLLFVAGGYWAFSLNYRGKLEQARGLAETKRLMAEGEAKPALDPRTAAPAPRGPQAEGARAEGPERATAARNRGEPAVQVVAMPAAEPTRPLANAPSAAPGAASDGLYAGPICYGPAGADRPRCFRAQATISRGKIAGQWPARDPGVTMVMAGEVSASGEARIHIQAEKPDGTRSPVVDLAGRLKNGRLDAAGIFRNGRTATLDWRKSVTGSR